MKLFYHKGENFGDAINPILLEALLPDFFDNDTSEIFVGIGSILGWINPSPNTTRIIVFSSGYGFGNESTYGKLPVIDSRFDVLCVRGKLTAEKLGLPESVVVSDGALLLPLVIQPNNRKKKFDFSYMPHVGSIDLYSGWEKVMKTCGIHFIDPRKPPIDVIEELNRTKVLLTEAMHGAIAADAYQIPWVAVKTNKTINDFKWKDYLSSVNLNYSPRKLPTLYDQIFLKGIFKSKLKKYSLTWLASLFTCIFYFYQNIIILPIVKRQLRRIKSAETCLCTAEILDEKQQQLLRIIEKLKQKK